MDMKHQTLTRAGFRLGAALSVLVLLNGCVTAGAGGGPSLARFNNPADVCNDQRQPLLATESQLSQTMVAGALIGGVAGAGVAAAVSDGDAGAILAGALIGGLAGASLGYHEGLSRRHASREAILDEIDQDAGQDATSFSTARGTIAALNACRNRQIDATEAAHAAGRLSTAQAKARLDRVRLAVDQDNELIHQVLGHMTRRTDTYLDAARRTTDLDESTILGAAADYEPGAILWNPATKSGRILEVSVPSANLRAGPGTRHRVVGSLRSGDTVKARGQSGDWIGVEHDSGPAFIHASLIAPRGATTTTAALAPKPRPAVDTDLQRAVLEARDTEAAGQQNKAQLSSRLDDLYTILGTN